MASERELMRVVETRASVRRFRQDPIPDEVLKKILWSAVRAPTAGGRENWFFVVVKSSEMRAKIHRLIIDSHIRYARDIAKMPSERIEKWRKLMEEGMYLAPLYIAVYIDMSRLTSAGEADVFNSEFIMEVQSAAAAMENAILTSWSLGIGSVWLGAPLLLEEEFRMLLDMPREYKLMGILALGYPLETPSPRRRKPLEEVFKVL
ncbi:MAG: nitroreductase family protein [Sulfolobales archaeon]|nr:nitroreductase family protein [Sulfolobales archaeon]MCX8208133.1 nitroreductase family protein [Sulfolobales archaeon]MDW8010544.1 nitroreductase family protein [Sulfolobales archaeon]